VEPTGVGVLLRGFSKYWSIIKNKHFYSEDSIPVLFDEG
jgi:hypothetical protein